MEAEEFLYRALGVPGIVTAANRAEAAGARLQVAGGLVDTTEFWPSKPEAIRTTVTAVLDAVATALRSGALDPLLGDYGDPHIAWVATRIAADATGDPGFDRRFIAQTDGLVRVAIDKLVVFAAARPELGWSQP